MEAKIREECLAALNTEVVNDPFFHSEHSAMSGQLFRLASGILPRRRTPNIRAVD